MNGAPHESLVVLEEHQLTVNTAKQVTKLQFVASYGVGQ